MSPFTILRRFGLWLVVCTIAAVPSFSIARDSNAHVGGMIAAIPLFSVLYTIVTCLPSFDRFHARPFVRTTLYIGYGARMIVSAIAAVGLILPNRLTGLAFVDLIPGMISIGLAAGLLGATGSSEDIIATPIGAFTATCIQGALLNMMIFVLMAVAYGLQRAFRKPPPQVTRGFEVITEARSMQA